MFKKIILALGIMVLILLSFQPAFSEIDRVEMQINGMTCPFCVYGIEKKLEALEEVEDASANLKTGIVDIKLKKDEPIDIERLNEAVRETGFTPGGIKITATGSLIEYNGYPALKVAGSDQDFLLVGKHEHEKEEFLSKGKIDQIKAATENGTKTITITGYVHTHRDFSLALSVDSFKIK